MSVQASHFRRFQFRGYDPEQLRQVVDGSDMEHTILAPVTCTAMVQQFQTNRVLIDIGYYNFPVVARGQFPKGRICIGFSWGQKESAWANGVELKQTTIMIHAEGNDLLYRAAANSGWMVVMMSREALQSASVEHLGRELKLPDRGSLYLRVPTEFAERLVNLIHSTGRQLEGRGSAETGIADQLLVTACLETIASGDPALEQELQRRVCERNQIIRRADTAMRHLVGGSYSSDQICRALGVTERTLQLYFKESLGVTPKGWFQRLALNRAHGALLHRPIQKSLVTEVALDCGFEHFGRFAQSYRELFGQAPSETVQGRLSKSTK